MANKEGKALPPPLAQTAARPRRPRPGRTSPAQGSNAQPLDLDFSAPEAAPCGPLKKQPAPQQGSLQAAAAGQKLRSSAAQGRAARKQSRGQALVARKPAAEKAQPPRYREPPAGAIRARPKKPSPRASSPAVPRRSRSSRPGRPGVPGAAAGADLGPVLDQRRPPQQKFTSFEVYECPCGCRIRGLWGREPQLECPRETPAAPCAVRRADRPAALRRRA